MKNIVNINSQENYQNYKLFIGSEVEYEIRITFEIKYKVDFGKAIYLLGSLEE